MSEWRLLDLEWPNQLYKNMAAEEAILEAVGEGSAPTTVRFWRNDKAVIIGRFQCPTLEIDPVACKEYDVKIVRRFTGGGAVYHDIGNLNYTVVARKPDENFTGNLLKDMEVVGNAVVKGLSHLGIKAEFKPINDIEFDGKKISGMAGSLRRGAFFVHGCLLVNSELSILAKVLKVSKEKFEGKSVRSTAKRVITIREILNRDIEMDEIKDVLKKGFEEHFKVSLRKSSLNRSEEDKLKDFYTNKYKTLDWSMGPCRRCSMGMRDRRLMDMLRAVE